MSSHRVLRLLRGRLRPGTLERVAAAVRDHVLPEAASVDALATTLIGVRGDGDGGAFLAVTTWHDLAGVAAASSGLHEPAAPVARLAGSVDFEVPEHFELTGQDHEAPRTMSHGAMGLVRFTAVARDEPAALDLVRRQQASLLADGSVHGLFVGRRIREPETEIVAVALWADRDRMRRFLAERPEGPGIDRRLEALATTLRFETFDVLSPRVHLSHAAAAALALDDDRVIVDASPMLESLLGVPGESLIGRRLDDIVAERARADVPRRWRRLLESGADDAMVETRTGDGGAILLRHESIANVPGPGLHGVLLRRPAAPPVGDVEGEIRRALGGWRVPQLRSEGLRHRIRPEVVTLPSTDELFNRFVLLALDALGVPSMRRLQLHLRGLYPHAVVHRRELAGEDQETWYVFRDGRVRPSRLPARWWDDPGVARCVVDRTGRLVEANDAAMELYGPPREAVLTRDVRSFGIPGSFEDLAVLLEIAFELRSVESALRIIDPAGGPLDVAFRGAREGDTMAFAAMRLPAPDGSREWFAPICLPSWDAAFISRVEDLCGRLAPRDPREVSEELAVRLRVTYPRASVRPLGRPIGFGLGTEVLLVYRDGEPEGDERWWEQPGTAEVTIADDRYVEANAEAAALHGVTRDELVRSRTRRFGVAADDRVLLRDVLHRTGSLHTTSQLRRGDGTLIDVEFRAVLLASDPPTIHVAMRAAPVPASPAAVPGAPLSQRVPEPEQPAG